jgi:AAA family ATPase
MTSVFTISAKAFTVTLADLLESEFRSARRVIVNADLLKASKLSAGDVVALVHAESPNSSPIVSISIQVNYYL